MSKVSIKAIVIGGVTDITSSAILGIPLVIYVMATTRGLATLPKDQIQAAVTAALHGSPALFTVQLAVGSACSALGGYVAARIAKRAEALNGLLSSFLCIAFGIYSLTGGADWSPSQLLWLVLSPLCGLLGGYLRLTQVRAKAG